MTGLLPPNATAAERAMDAATARLGEVLAPVADVWNPRTCPENVLPFLAWAFSVDGWDATWPVATKRRVIAASMRVHQIKGTKGAVVDALDSGGFAATVTEWWERTPAGPTDTFEVRVSAEGSEAVLDHRGQRAAINLVNGAKRLSQHFDLALEAAANGGIGLCCGGAAAPVLEADLEPASGMGGRVVVAGAACAGQTVVATLDGLGGPPEGFEEGDSDP